jgi:hypothetical protein
MILLQVNSQPASRGFSDAPMVLSAFEDGRLLVFRDPTAERPVFVVYKPRN